MTLKLTIRVSTSDDEIDANIPFLDMRDAAKRHRDDCKTAGRLSDQTIMRLHDIDGVTVLEDEFFGCFVNEDGPGVGNSLIVEAFTPAQAAKAWRNPELLD